MLIEERPQHLVVLDGTWFHAKKIYNAHHWLRELPHVRLTPSDPSVDSLYKGPM